MSGTVSSFDVGILSFAAPVCGPWLESWQGLCRDLSALTVSPPAMAAVIDGSATLVVSVAEVADRGDLHSARAGIEGAG